ncbi:unnamed protein product [Schistocephalus solidus]|uniref:BCAS3 n=1 Tax=Schistocephalus solidus TaxID=70667 RepID=A0A183TAX7_SCHSO|nr:unnamed protein product [Schistocephalus solidus]
MQQRSYMEKDPRIVLASQSAMQAESLFFVDNIRVSVSPAARGMVGHLRQMFHYLLSPAYFSPEVQKREVPRESASADETELSFLCSSVKFYPTRTDAEPPPCPKQQITERLFQHLSEVLEHLPADSKYPITRNFEAKTNEELN